MSNLPALVAARQRPEMRHAGCTRLVDTRQSSSRAPRGLVSRAQCALSLVGSISLRQNLRKAARLCSLAATLFPQSGELPGCSDSLMPLSLRSPRAEQVSRVRRKHRAALGRPRGTRNGRKCCRDTLTTPTERARWEWDPLSREAVLPNPPRRELFLIPARAAELRLLATARRRRGRNIAIVASREHLHRHSSTRRRARLSSAPHPSCSRCTTKERRQTEHSRTSNAEEPI